MLQIPFCKKIKVSTIEEDIFDYLSDIFFENIFKQQSLDNTIINELKNKLFDKKSVDFGLHYLPLGAKYGTLDIELKDLCVLDLTKEIGEGKLLFINYAPDNTIFPIEMHMNSPFQINRFSLQRTLAPINLCNTSNNTSYSKVRVFYVYLPKNCINDICIKELSDAFYDYFNKDYNSSLLKLQIACEFILTRFLNKNGHNDIKTQRMPYSKKLNNLLPKTITDNNMIPCPSIITNEINNMRLKRNDIAHAGGSININDTDMRTWIITAFLFYKYFKVIHNV
ncbi:hypothetical protein DXD38_05545 [Megamonas funiformis]|jgi:hypothetical protein|uniref:hypothetical protein n=1 Tax=Megamonas funiformis TaxID=437897 RepID=UPI000E3F891C|nr:hypothetical protein [Megamonas funiformis]MBD9296965.1 hypothetical protein [Megamonas funiformis]RGJ98351.1 hypothetical protein DXD38_05545 [Megamonas funiformis]